MNNMPLSLIITLILSHFLSDWLLQSRKMATSKSSNPLICLLHSAITGTFLFIACCIGILFSIKICLWAALILSFFYTFTHFVQDTVVWKLYGKFHDPKKEFQSDYWFYTTIAIDQSIHLIIMFILTTLAIMDVK